MLSFVSSSLLLWPGKKYTQGSRLVTVDYDDGGDDDDEGGGDVVVDVVVVVIDVVDGGW
jgi:hypothetical protein